MSAKSYTVSELAGVERVSRAFIYQLWCEAKARASKHDGRRTSACETSAGRRRKKKIADCGR